MADFAIGRTGGSLRDALNELFPMTGLGEYGAGFPPNMFPPQTGSPQPSGPVPIPTQRPPQAPIALPPPVAMPQIQAGMNSGLPPAIPMPQVQGGANSGLPPPVPMPQVTPRTSLPPDLAARLMQLIGPGGY